ncbi:MAG: response regulator [Planctomycetota bacterium]|nr:response regulator [Planctomycetota bacterium]
MRKKILVAEDNRSFRLMLNLILSETYDVTMTSSGKELEEALATSAYDLLITDLILQGRSAMAIVRQHSREMGEEHAIPAIVVTGMDEEHEDVRAAKRMVNVREVFRKPVDFKTLKTCIDGLLDAENASPVCSQIYRAVATMPRVLIVDDEAEMRDYMYEVLEEAGIESSTCGTVEEAIRLCGEYSFDAVILDYVLADGTADEVLEQVSAATKSAKMPPIMVVTGFSDMVTLEHFAAHPTVQEVVAKPFNPDDFVARVKKVMAKSVTAAV